MTDIRRRLLPLAFALLSLGGCNSGLVAPEGKQSNAFLDRIAAKCGKLSIGHQPLGYLLDVNSNDVYFVDEASKLATGSLDRKTFANDINAFYPTGSNQPALACIFGQLDAD